MKVNVYENSDGMIRAVVMDGAEIRNIVSGLEDGDMTRNEFIAAARSGFERAGDHDSGNDSGTDMSQAVKQLEETDDLIAEITQDSVEMHLDKMGLAGHILFEIGQFI